MRRFVFLSIGIICLIMCLLSACSSGDAEDVPGAANASAEEGAETEDKPKDAYDEYIRNAIASVDGNKNGEAEPAPDEEPVRSITVDRTAPSDFYISSMENEDAVPDPYVFTQKDEETDVTPTASESPSPTEDVSGTPTPTPTPYITPDEFEVDTCCIYMNGESDSAYGTEVVTAINKTREDLGYKPFEKNKGLSDCADRRTREIAANFSHTRPNGQPFYSVAPEHFKAEMLIVNNQKAEDAVDTLIKRDPVSRALIFTNKYRSIGASSFKCNGMKYTVVSFGL